MDQAAAAAAQAQLAAVQGVPEARDQPQVGLVVRLGMSIPVTLTMDENGSITTVGLGRPSFDVQDYDNDDDDDQDYNNDSEEDSDNDDALMDTEDESGYESDDSVVFLGEVIRLD